MCRKDSGLEGWARTSTNKRPWLRGTESHILTFGPSEAQTKLTNASSAAKRDNSPTKPLHLI